MESINLFEAMRTQPSMRGYTADPVSDEDVLTILEAATWAPNAQNRQLWEFVVVRDADMKVKLAEIYRKSLSLILESIPMAEGDPGEFDTRTAPRAMINWSVKLADTLEQVPVLIVVAWDLAGSPHCPDGIFKVFRDETVYTGVMPAVQNLMLAARALGLGTCLTTVANVYEGHVKELLEVPPSVRIVAMIPVGYPSEPLSPRKRIPVAEKLHHDRW
jgi:nitroreductase